MSHHQGAAAAHRTIAGLYGLLAVLFPLFVVFLGDGPTPWPLVIGLSALFVVPIALHLAIAHGAERCRPWARVASIVLGVLLLGGFPIGTALGIWLLINAVPQWVEERRYSGSLADGWPQPPASSAPPPLPTQEAAPARTPLPESIA